MYIYISVDLFISLYILYLYSHLRPSNIGKDGHISGVLLLDRDRLEVVAVHRGQQVELGQQLEPEQEIEVDALRVKIISRGCFERCCSNKKTPP